MIGDRLNLSARRENRDNVVQLPVRRVYERDGACPWCSVGLHEWCSSTAAAYAPCTCCGESS